MSENNHCTYSEIARAAGVSISTVSLVLRGMSIISDDIRERVLKAARQQGYQLQPFHPAIKKMGLKHIGLLIKSYQGESVVDNLFFAHITDGVRSVTDQNQIELTIAAVPVDDRGIILEMPKLVIQHKVDAVLAVNLNLDEDSTMQIDRYGVPIVLVDSYSKANAYDSVMIDNFQGTYDAIAYLISLGHRHIALAGSSESSFPGLIERRRGYLQALLDHGIAEPYLIDSAFDRNEVYRACLAYFNQPRPVTAILGINDWVSEGIMTALHELDIPIPGRISVMGFDDILIIPVDPPLASMSVDCAGLGRQAAMLLINRVQNPHSGLIKTTLTPKVVVRPSIRRIELAGD